MPKPDGIDETVTQNLDRPFPVARRGCYLIGHTNGSFPNLGHHLAGEMGGLWTPLLKLADGLWFGLRGTESMLPHFCSHKPPAGGNRNGVAKWVILFREFGVR